MSKKFDIKPPIWPKELTFQEFKRFNPLINESQLIPLYNQYLTKFLTELAELKIHFKQSLNKQLVVELELLKEELAVVAESFTASPGGAGFSYASTGIGSYSVGAYLGRIPSPYRSFADRDSLGNFTREININNPVNEGYPRFVVGRPGPGAIGVNPRWPVETNYDAANNIPPITPG